MIYVILCSYYYVCVSMYVFAHLIATPSILYHNEQFFIQAVTFLSIICYPLLVFHYALSTRLVVNQQWGLSILMKYSWVVKWWKGEIEFSYVRSRIRCKKHCLYGTRGRNLPVMYRKQMRANCFIASLIDIVEFVFLQYFYPTASTWGLSIVWEQSKLW